MSGVLKKTICVSFPRSGHHLLLRGLHTLIPEHLVYSEGYKSSHNMINCDHVNLQKDHDLDLDMEPVEGFQYLVLTREAEPAITSWHKMLTTYEWLDVPLEEFMKEKMKFYRAWHKKWIDENPNPGNTKIVHYRDLVRNKEATVQDVADWMITDCTSYADKLPALATWAAGEDRFTLRRAANTSTLKTSGEGPKTINK